MAGLMGQCELLLFVHQFTIDPDVGSLWVAALDISSGFSFQRSVRVYTRRSAHRLAREVPDFEGGEPLVFAAGHPSSGYIFRRQWASFDIYEKPAGFVRRGSRWVVGAEWPRGLVGRRVQVGRSAACRLARERIEGI